MKLIIGTLATFGALYLILTITDAVMRLLGIA